MTSLIRQQGRWKKALAVVLVLASLGWAGWLLRDAWDTFRGGGVPADGLLLTLSLALLVLSQWLAYPSFAGMLAAVAGARVPKAEVRRLYFVSQMMKHLPGRFFGVAYQALYAPHIASSTQWIAVNMAYMVLTLGAAVLVSVLVLVATGVLDKWIVLPAIACPFLALHLLPWVVGLRTWGGRLGTLLGALLDAVFALRTSRSAIPIFGWFGASWLFYLVAWAVLGDSLGTGLATGVELCALYTLSWVLGFVTLVTPSGLGVREFAFVVLAARHPPDIVACVAVFARLGMILADLILGGAQLVRRSRYG
jgi:hypothetical protein